MNFPDNLDDLQGWLKLEEINRRAESSMQPTGDVIVTSIHVNIALCAHHFGPLPCAVHGCINHFPHEGVQS